MKTAPEPSIRIPRVLLLALLLVASAAWAEAQWSEERRSRRDFTERQDLRVTRPEAMAAMRPALDLAGDAGRGEESFLELCARCHRSGPLGGGPGRHGGPACIPEPLTDRAAASVRGAEWEEWLYKRCKHLARA